MKVLLRNPRREVQVDGPLPVRTLLDRLGLEPAAHLVIRNAELVPADAVLEDADAIEVRPVVSGGGS